MKNKLSIALIRPLIREYFNSQSPENLERALLGDGMVPPLNLCCLAAETQQAGFNVSIYDCEANNNSDKLLEDFLTVKKPDVVGISIITTNFRGALQTAKIVRKVLPKAVIVCGGTHMMIFAKETLSYFEFDYGFIGEAEKPFVDFLNHFQEDSADFLAVPGLAWRQDGNIIINEPLGFNQDLDSLPFPAYDLLDLSGYRLPNTRGNLISLFLSRGCPFSCGFCFRNPQLKMMRFKSVDRAIEEIDYMVKNYDVKSINFVDETISLRKDYFLEFCEKLASKKLNIEWQSPNRVTSIDEDIVRAAKRAGCHTFRLGIESGSDEILNKINKGINTEASREAVRLCRKYGIKTVGYFILGYLGETDETIKQTVNFAKDIKPDYALFFPATPMPSTNLCKESEDKGLIPKDYWRDFVLGRRSDSLPFIFPNVDKWVGKAYRHFYFTPLYIFKQMKTIKFYRNFLQNFKIALSMLFIKFKKQNI